MIEVQNSILTRPRHPPPAGLMLLGVLRGLYSLRFSSALPLEVEFISKSENVVHFFANFATILVLQETRKILIWGVPVHPAGRSRGFEGILGGNIRFPSIQFYPQRPALYPNGACVLLFCKKKLAKFQETRYFSI